MDDQPSCNCWNCKHLLPAMREWITEALDLLPDDSPADFTEPYLFRRTGENLLEGHVRREAHT